MYYSIAFYHPWRLHFLVQTDCSIVILLYANVCLSETLDNLVTLFRKIFTGRHNLHSPFFPDSLLPFPPAPRPFLPPYLLPFPPFLFKAPPAGFGAKPTHFCGIRVQKKYLVIAVFGYLRL